MTTAALTGACVCCARAGPLKGRGPVERDLPGQETQCSVQPEQTTPVSGYAFSQNEFEDLWRARFFPFAIVQALKGPDEYALRRDPCLHDAHGDHCPGTSRDATSGVFLDRADALHCAHIHYRFANQSVCRFRSASRGLYAADLIFDIDAHEELPELDGPVPLSWFLPKISAAVFAGHKVLVYLIDTLGVHPKYITTSVTRLGSRVTVDWRAFGPRTMRELLGVMWYVEAQVFADGELTALGLVVDETLYTRSDAPRIGIEDANTFRGAWLRPVGAMHSKSGDGGWWYRITPVPHAQFREGNAERLVRESRGPWENWRTWPNRLLPDDFVWRVPESRNPNLDACLEADPRPAANLVALFDRRDLLIELKDDQQATIKKLCQRSTIKKLRAQNSDQELRDEDVEAFVMALRVDHRERGDRWEIPCPRPTCKPVGRAACLFKDGGTFNCFRCGGLSLIALASELGLSHALPFRAASSTPLALVVQSSVPKPTYMDDWGWHVDAVDRVFKSPEALWADREAELTKFLSDDRARVFIDAGGVGTGKSTVVRKFLAARGLRHRTFVARDESKTEYLNEVPGTIAVQGRRLGTNCTNERLEEVIERREPVAKTLCSVCPHREGCEYYAQFEGLTANTGLALTHGHGGTAHLSAFDNSPDVDIVDEDALQAVAQHDVLDVAELNRLRVGWAYDFDLDPDAQDTTADCGRWYAGATPALDTMIARLQALLSHDAIIDHDIRAARSGELIDLGLANYLMGDPRLREAVRRITDPISSTEGVTEDLGLGDIGEHEACRLALQKEWQEEIQKKQPPIVGYTNEGEPIFANRDPRREKRPKDIIKALCAALNAAYCAATMGVNQPLALQAFKADEGNSWVLQLTTRKPFLSRSAKLIVLSATATPERLRLVYGRPTSESTWRVYRPNLVRKERRIVIADKTLSRSALTSAKSAKLVSELFETADALIAREYKRTGLPVAVIGSSLCVNLFMRHRLGATTANQYAMPWKGAKRAEMMEELRSYTMPQGWLAGYSGAVSGSNEYSVIEDGKRRFCRSEIVLGNVIPNLTSFARDVRGLYAGVRDTALDTTQLMRTVAFEGTQEDGLVQVARNQPGYRDCAANGLLYGAFEGEVVQMVGRMRGQLPDPVRPGIVPTVWVLASVAIPGWEVDLVTTMDRLRGMLGLATSTGRRGRPPTASLDDQTKRRWMKFGAPDTMRWLTEICFRTVQDDTAVTSARLIIQRSGLNWHNRLIQVGLDTVAKLRVTP